MFNIKASQPPITFSILSSSVVVLLIFTFLTLSKPAQATEIKKQLSKSILTTEEVSEKLQLAEQNKRTNPALFKKLLSELNQQPKLTTEQQYLFNFLDAYSALYAGQYDKANNGFEALLHSNANNLIKFKSNYLLIYLATATKNWEAGLKYVAANIKLIAVINSGEPYQNSLLATIMFYSKIGEYEIALSYIDKLSKEKLSAKNNCGLLQLSLEAKLKLNRLKEPDSDFEHAINNCINANFIIAANFIRFNKAELYLQHYHPEKAIDSLLTHSAEIHGTHYLMLIADFNNVLAKAYLQTNDVESAKTHAIRALANNPNSENFLQGVDSYFLLYKIAKKQQDLSLALEYFEKYAEIEKSHLEGEKVKHLAFQLAEHQAFEKESQIKLLDEKNNLLAAEQTLVETKVNNRHLIIILLTVIIVMLTLGGLRLWRTHKRVKELAEYDPLTGIFNRGHFTQVSKSALRYCQSAEQDLSIIMFDLDHFKKINDRFGHLCGDWALKQVTKACEKLGRQNDIFARLGGEEFCIVLPSCNIDVAMLRAEACRAAIEEIVTEESGYEFTITASFGVTDVKRSGFDLDKLLADADFAAYASKHADRNRVSIYVTETASKK